MEACVGGRGGTATAAPASIADGAVVGESERRYSDTLCSREATARTAETCERVYVVVVTTHEHHGTVLEGTYM